MKKSTKRLLGGAALVAAAAGAIGAVIMNRDGKPKRRPRRDKRAEPNMWARPGMTVTFRAELMPGRETSERTFQVTNLLPSGRVLLDGVSGEHTETEFQPLRCSRNGYSPFIGPARFHHTQILNFQFIKFARDSFAVGRFEMYCEDVHAVVIKLAELTS